MHYRWLENLTCTDVSTDDRTHSANPIEQTGSIVAETGSHRSGRKIRYRQRSTASTQSWLCILVSNPALTQRLLANAGGKRGAGVYHEWWVRYTDWGLGPRRIELLPATWVLDRLTCLLPFKQDAEVYKASISFTTPFAIHFRLLLPEKL